MVPPGRLGPAPPCDDPRRSPDGISKHTPEQSCILRTPPHRRPLPPSNHLPQGVSWRLGYTAADLIGNKELPPFVIVAIDSVGAMRSLNYLPYPPGSGQGGFRGDCERWPGGGLALYMERLVDELMPMATDRYNLATDPAKVGAYLEVERGHRRLYQSGRR